jgi:3-oxoacyl-ACP reductase-like protein
MYLIYILSQYLFPDLSSKPDKVAIVTGGSRGIGAEVVKKLLQCDMEVIIGNYLLS